MRETAENVSSHAHAPGLSSRESDVLRMVAAGLTNVQIAGRLDVTVHAVKFHLASIYRKLGVSNRTQAAVRFAEQGSGATSAAE